MSRDCTKVPSATTAENWAIYQRIAPKNFPLSESATSASSPDISKASVRIRDRTINVASDRFWLLLHAMVSSRLGRLSCSPTRGTVFDISGDREV